MIMQKWMDDTHGRVIGGRYDGSLLRSGFDNGSYIDMLMSGGGWVRLGYYRHAYRQSDKEKADSLLELKNVIDEWLLM